MWKEFNELVVPTEASDAQRLEVRKAFYSGAAALFNLLTHSSVNAGQAATVELMSIIHNDVYEFGLELDVEMPTSH